jgi:outer membrane protein TolC
MIRFTSVSLILPIRRVAMLSCCALLALATSDSPAEEKMNGKIQREWVAAPLSLAEALNLALKQNRAVLKSSRDLEISHGVAMEVRAIAIPKLQATGKYTDTDTDALEPFPGQPQPHQSWNAGIQVIQSLYEGGRFLSAFRAAKLTREQAILAHQTVIADTLLATRVAYYDVLLAAQDIVVREASVELLGKELNDQQQRYDSGTVPRFNVLRAEVAVANAKPALIRAKNNLRIARNNLLNLLGYDLVRDSWEDIPLQLTDTLDVADYSIGLSDAIQQALGRRTELGALRTAAALRKEDITQAQSGRLPSVQAFAGWGWRNRSFSSDVTDSIDGWQVGVQGTWNIFDGFQTRGKVLQARAAHEKSRLELDDVSGRIQIEVRTAHSSFMQSRELLESQKKVQEQAEEALRLARSRAESGVGTQLDVLNAETALTEARTTQIQARHEYAVAVAKLERAIGATTK